jgi:protein-disulfide isomerase
MLAEEAELELDERPPIEDAEKSIALSDVRLHWPEFASRPPGEVHTRKRLTIGPRTTRRGALIGAGAIALCGALGIAIQNRGYFSETIFGADLMRAGPLGEEALGEEQAPHTVIEYASLTCPHCAKFSEETFPALKAGYIDTGKVRFILREFPLDALAHATAVLARAAAPESYFPFVEALLRRQREWMVDSPVEPLFAIARGFGFTSSAFQAAVSDQRLIAGVDWVRVRASEKFKVGAAPTFFVDGKMRTGFMSLEQLVRIMG